MNIAEQLLQGSRNIDKMERDINDLTSMILGIIIACRASPIDQDESRWFNGKDLDWNLRVHPCGGWILECMTVHSVIYSSTTYGKNHLHRHTQQIQDVYESLPILVEGIKNTFPQIGKHLEPFLRASSI